MSWKKLGQVFDPQVTKKDWYQDTFLTPTPFLKDADTIRVYGGLRDAAGASRIGYVDVAASDPTKVLKVSDKPVLDLGQDGMFDDNGVILGDVVRAPDGTVRMYYVGFQLPKKAKFLAFSGVAISHDNGETFNRCQETPILDRAPNGRFIRAIHSILFEDGLWKVWFSAGDGWQHIDGRDYPQYNIWYTTSKDGLTFDQPEHFCLDVAEGEYRIGRPRVRRIAKGYEMRFTYDTLSKDYRTGTAFSADGINWQRNDNQTGITPGPEAWDAQTLCYPAIINVNGKDYMFYNGNNMGQTGFGVAVATSNKEEAA